MGKKQFYPKIDEAFKAQGYQYYDGDNDIKGKGKSHASKPDYIAVKDSTLIIGEIKSPDEGPTSSSWRQIQKSDSENFQSIRKEVVAKEKTGSLPKEVGGHEIIIKGQIPDYISKLSHTYDLPERITEYKNIKCGYSVPASEAENLETALKNHKIRFEKFSDSDSANYIFQN